MIQQVERTSYGVRYLITVIGAIAHAGLPNPFVGLGAAVWPKVSFAFERQPGCDVFLSTDGNAALDVAWNTAATFQINITNFTGNCTVHVCIELPGWGGDHTLTTLP